MSVNYRDEVTYMSIIIVSQSRNYIQYPTTSQSNYSSSSRLFRWYYIEIAMMHSSLALKNIIILYCSPISPNFGNSKGRTYISYIMRHISSNRHSAISYHMNKTKILTPPSHNLWCFLTLWKDSHSRFASNCTVAHVTISLSWLNY